MKTDLQKYFERKRRDFPILDRKVNKKPLIYFDNAATSQKPQVMVDALTEYYTRYNANVHRGIHYLSEKATEEYEGVRAKVATLINCSRKEIVFNSGTTDALNMLAIMLEAKVETGDEILLSDMEHHANLVIWQELAKKKNLTLKFMEYNKNYELDLEQIENLITSKTKIVAFPHVSNVLGTINPVRRITKLAHAAGAYVVLDAAQSVPHMIVDVKNLDVDFLVFSSHKMCGPTGVGIMYGKEEHLETLSPVRFGGNMIEDVELGISTYAKSPQKYETGTPNIADVIAFGTSLDYLRDVEFENIEGYLKLLAEEMLRKLQTIKGLELYGPTDSSKRSPVFSFTLKGIHAIDLAHLLDQQGIAIRTGHHCAIPIAKKHHISSSTRVSLYFYNTFEEIEKFIEVLEEITEKYH